MVKVANPKVILLIMIFSQQLVQAQGVYNAAADEAKLKDYQGRIIRTAEALGVRLSEELPVYAGPGGQDRPASAFTAPQSGSRAALPMPALSGSSPLVPSDMPLPEPISNSGNAVVIWHSILAQIGDLGLPLTGSAPSFEEISKRVNDIVKKTSFKARNQGQPSLFTESGFVKEFESATGALFMDGNSTKLLIDGEEAFAVKDSLIKNSKKSLLISTWAFYDDITGYQTAQMLIEKKKQGVDIKIILDNKIVYSHGRKVIKMMKNSGIEIIRYEDSERGGDYWHVKMMIADDKYAIVGGMNFGDPYSHRDPNFFKWRDTDIMYSGPAALQSRRIFARIWNAKVKEINLPFRTLDPGSDNCDFEAGSARISIMLQDPPKTSPILVSIIKAIYGASKVVNIENAYMVAIPVVTQAVLDARARGVEVNILTNSKESIDAEGRPIIDAMAKCLIPFVQAGANVYLKQGKGDTLHSKFMTVDGLYTSIGSYNIHPRGERSDTELNLNILDKSVTEQLDAVFIRDISSARKIDSVNELRENPGLLSQIMSEFFYAQLSPGKQ